LSDAAKLLFWLDNAAGGYGEVAVLNEADAAQRGGGLRSSRSGTCRL